MGWVDHGFQVMVRITLAMVDHDASTHTEGGTHLTAAHPSTGADAAAAASHPSTRRRLRVVDRPAADRFAECRSLGHSWRHKQTIGVDDSSSKYPRPFGFTTGMVGYQSVCSVCKMLRIKWITRSGETVPRYYPPEGYGRSGDDVLSPKEWRQNFVASLFDSWSGGPST